jgi:protein disulfide-isomerase
VHLPALLLAALPLAPLAAAPGSPSAAAHPDEGRPAWTQELDAATALARESGRDLLLNFTGSDWCSWCKRLKREVLIQEAFLTAASRDYVLVTVDLPRSPEAVAAVPDLPGNRALAKRYGVQSFPTVVLVTADGEEYGRTGYREGGAGPYLEHLAELRRTGRAPLMAAKELRRAFDGGDAEARAAAAASALELFPRLPEGSAGVALRVPVLAHHRVLDPEDERGDLTRSLRLLLLSTKADEASIALARARDPRNAAGLLELAVYAEAYWAARPEDQRRMATEILALHRLGPVRESRAAAILYPYGALWVGSHLRDREAAKELARLGLPHLKAGSPLARQLQGLLSQR